MIFERNIETEADLRASVSPGRTYEDESLEFKEKVSFNVSGVPWEKEPARELARDIAGLANASGGCLLIGVAEGPSTSGGYQIAAGIPGVAAVEPVRKFFDQDIRNYLAPPDLTYSVRVVARQVGDPVVAVNVPAFERGVAAVWHSGASRYVEYPYRTSFGKEYLLPHRVEERMMDRTRAIELRARRLFARYGTKPATVRFLSPILISGQRQSLTGFQIGFHGIRESEVDLRVHGHGSGARRKTEIVAIPFGIIDEIWDTGGQIGLLLRLSLMLFHDPQIDALLSPL